MFHLFSLNKLLGKYFKHTLNTLLLLRLTRYLPTSMRVCKIKTWIRLYIHENTKKKLLIPEKKINKKVAICLKILLIPNLISRIIYIIIKQVTSHLIQGFRDLGVMGSKCTSYALTRHCPIHLYIWQMYATMMFQSYVIL